MSTHTIEANIYWKNEEEQRSRIEKLKVLGAGRAATASLVRVTRSGHEPLICVEKCFKPGVLTRFIYWCFFQSPFPYQHDRNAIGATYYRRTVAEKLLQAMCEESNPVASPLYTRWDEENSAFVLAAEFVEGRGIIPQEIDSFRFRRMFYNLGTRLFAVITRKKPAILYPPPEEAKELTGLMRRFEKTFKASGLTGTGWQTSPSALVSTANLLRVGDRYTMVDLESGIPAVLVPSYVVRAVLTGKFPLFDDMEPKKLDRFIKENGEHLEKALGSDGFSSLVRDAEKLGEYTKQWKEAEIAVFRTLPALLFSPKKRRAVRTARFESWFREGIVDEETYERSSKSGRLYTEPLFLAGAPPGRLGLFFRKTLGNREFRAKVKLFISDREYRRKKIEEYVNLHAAAWVEEGRFNQNPDLSFGAGFIWHLILSKVTRPGLQRFMTDRAFRKNILLKIGLFLTSDRYQLEYSKYVVYKGMLEWKNEKRITGKQFDELAAELESGSIQEYVRVFGIQVALKFFEALTSAIKVAGIGWYLTSFAMHFPDLDPGASISTRLLSAFLQTAVMNPLSILMMINTSVWRTLITLQRMISIKRRHISYRTALFFGMIPALGTLAYPVQMYAGCRELSIYLMRHILSRVGRGLPIYGGKDSLTELWMIKTINVLVEILESVKWLWARSFGSIFSKAGKKTEKKKLALSTPEMAGNGKEKGRWAHLVEEHVSEIWSDLEEQPERAPAPAARITPLSR